LFFILRIIGNNIDPIIVVKISFAEYSIDKVWYRQVKEALDLVDKIKYGDLVKLCINILY